MTSEGTDETECATVEEDECDKSKTPNLIAGSKRSGSVLVCNCLIPPPSVAEDSCDELVAELDYDDVDGAFHSKKPKVSDEEPAPLVGYFPRYTVSDPLKGEFIIINNENFRLATQMDSRKGSSVDAANLAADFEKLGFKVRSHKDLTVDEMLAVITNAAKRATADHDCFGAAVLSHGDNDVLYGTDRTVSIEEFVHPIKTCTALLGKPKIFIFQACRGNRLDPGADVTDGPPAANKIPLEADMIYAYSTVPCYFSWRNVREGSWFIQALHKTMQQFFTSTELDEVDFVRLLTRVSHIVAYQFQSMSTKPEMHGMKQVPSIVSMLTKDFFLKRPRK